MNDEERRVWVLNDEGLYTLYRQDRTAHRNSQRALHSFIRRNRPVIDEVIGNVTSGRQPAHYLKYGGSEA